MKLYFGEIPENFQYPERFQTNLILPGRVSEGERNKLSEKNKGTVFFIYFLLFKSEY